MYADCTLKNNDVRDSELFLYVIKMICIFFY